MKNLSSIIISGLLFLGWSDSALAQCGAGEVEISIEFTTDNWGYETYWELVPQGNGCGNGTIASGGNTAQLNCNSGGAPYTASNGNGYGSNQTITVDNICVTEGTALDLIYVDDYGDGGTNAVIFVNGYQVGVLSGSGTGNTVSFNASIPPAFDFEGAHLHKPYSYGQPVPTTIEGEIINRGTTTITEFTLNYQIDNGPVQSVLVSGVNIANSESYEAVHPTSWLPDYGTYTVKFWASDLNGNGDLNTANDVVEKTVEIGPGIPNIIDSYLGLESYEIQEIGSAADGLDKPTDLDFHPVLSRKELWVVNKKTEANGGSTTTYYNAGESDQTDQTREDGNNWHFMSLPTGIAFGENENFATSPGVYDANHDGGGPFTGPALWSSDPAVYAQPSGGNGSHLDMLHESPYSQGIAHEKDNAYWVFDGNQGDIVMYDFKGDHGPGNADHGDAVIHRYSEDALAKDPANKIVSHLVLDKQTNWLYVVDHGNQRVIRIDITSGSVGGNATSLAGEQVAELKQIVGYTQENVVTAGLLKPAGIDVVDNRMIVSDHETGEVIIYDISSLPAQELGRIPTGAIGIMGVKIGPAGKIWFVDHDANKLYRIGGPGVGIKEQAVLKTDLYPNPSNGHITISTRENGMIDMLVTDMAGRIVLKNQFTKRVELDLPLSPGMYMVNLIHHDTGASSEQRLIITQ